MSFTESYFPGLPTRVRGNSFNDITIVGYYTMIAHFNGMTWCYYHQLASSNTNNLYSVSHRGNLVVAVGELYDPIHSKGLVFIGRR
ncbi:MAG: hypothetical protein HYR76_02015 [Ignavibacteria bacterium]|nr:hypothetical protein [Ignavibacteria bacterium]